MSNHPEQFARLVARLSQLDAAELSAVELAVRQIEDEADGSAWADSKVFQSDAGASGSHSHVFQSDAGPSHSIEKDWPRAPVHRLDGKGAYIVTGATLHKQHFFAKRESLDYLEAAVLEKAKDYGWQLEAWAVFSNHYHFVGQAMDDARSLEPMLKHLHSDTARWINEVESKPGRQVWYNFWETKLTYSKSYQARLQYVHRNAVHHGLVKVPNQYRWCSAAWFERTATPAQVKTIYSFKTDKIKINDDFEPVIFGVR